MSLRMEIIKLECLQFDAIFFFFFLYYISHINWSTNSLLKKKIIKLRKIKKKS